jgi:biotin carboxyl carrier protein
LVTEDGRTRTFMVTVEPATAAAPASNPQPAAAKPAAAGTSVFSTFAGSVEVVDILVKIGDSVKTGQAVAKIEAMKTEHEIKSPLDGTVSSINVKIGDEVDSSKPLMVIS